MYCARLATGVAILSSLGLLSACGDDASLDPTPNDSITVDVRDFEYVEDQYFFLDEVYQNAFPNQPADQALVNVQFVRVFVNDFNAANDLGDNAEPAVGFALWDPQLPREAASRAILNGGVEEGNFHELDDDDFDVDPRGYLVMRTPISRRHALAVAYQTIGGDFFGDIGQPSSAPRELKLIKARNQSFPIAPEDYPTWKLSWRNVYSLGGQSIQPEGLAVTVLREGGGQEETDNQDGTPYIQIFGLDTHLNGAAESTPPDNLIDIDGGANIPGLNLADGHLVFPSQEPFGGRGRGAVALLDDDRVPEIYMTTNSAAKMGASRFIIRVTYNALE